MYTTHIELIQSLYIYVDGKRGKVRLKKRWVDVMASDMRKVEVSEKNVGGTVKWKWWTRVTNPK